MTIIFISYAAITMLKDKQPGTFVVRDSNSFPGAFGLALKVSQVPPNVQTKGGKTIIMHLFEFIDSDFLVF